MAQYALGGAAEDREEFTVAISWYEKAADQNYGAAEFRLGRLLENGRGSPVDLTRALALYRRAAGHGSSAALDRLTELAAGTSAVPATSPATEASSSQPPPISGDKLDASPPAAIQSNATAATPDVTPTQTADVAASSALTAPVVVPSTDAMKAQLPAPTAPSPDSWTLTEQLAVAGIALYILFSGYCGVRLIRPRLLERYRSSWWLVSSSGRSNGVTAGILLGGQVGQIFFKRVLMRIQVEGLALTLGTVVGCVGGNLYYLVKRRRPGTAD